MNRFVLPIAVLCLTTAVAGCVTRVPVRGLHPARVSLGGGRILTIVEMTGRRSAAEYVNQEVARQSRHRGYFDVQDQSHQGTRVRVVGRRVVLDSQVLAAHTMGLRIDVLEWGAMPGVKTVKRKTEDGETHTDLVPVLRATTLLAITLFDNDDRAYLAETEYEGVAVSDRFDIAVEGLIERAAADAIAHFMADITPVEVVTRVRLDDDDPGQEQIIKIAKDGDLFMAAQRFRDYIARFPNNTSAAYNLAVLLDAMGSYEEALEMYDLAVSRSSKSYYGSARDACRRRLAAANTLASR